jgi:dipeptidyl aminopeptidase/acylaminoacyl peptidase
MSRLRLSLLFVVLVALAALSPAAVAGAEQLAYQCESDICLIDPDNPGGGGKDITNTPSAYEWYPQWSPLGNLIGYMGLYPPTDESWEIYTLDPAESDPQATNVSQTPDREENLQFDWSPDGSRIAFSSHPRSSANPLHDEAYVGRADGQALPVAIQSSAADEGGPHFSPDGNTVVMLRDGALYMAPADGSGTLTPVAGAPGPMWSPDGRYLAGFRFGSYPYGLEISNVDGSGRHELQKPIDLGTTVDWSCDSTRVAYVADEEPNLDQVWVAPVDGSNIGVQIPMPEGWIVPHNPTFSPDGTRIAFDARPNSSPGYEQLLIAPADGSAPAVPITTGALPSERPSWKPGPSCAGSVPPPVSPGGTGGSGSGSGGGGSSGTGPGGSLAPTQAPVKLKLSLFKQPVISGHFMTIAGIDCHAQGGHPTGKVAEICAAAANAVPTSVAPQTAFRLEKPKTSKPIFAKGAVKVPVGKTKKLKLKITPAGLKLLKPGKTLSLKLTITTRQGSSKPVTKTKTVKVKVPPKK